MQKSIFLQNENPNERSRLKRKVVAAGHQQPCTIPMLAFMVLSGSQTVMLPSIAETAN
jgi:hypothetical protein